MAYSCKMQRMVYYFFVVSRQASEETGVRLASKGYKLSYRQCSCKNPFRQYKSDGAR